MLYTHLQHHDDTIIKQTHDDKDAVINDARRKTQEDVFNNIFTFRKGLLKVCVWEGAGDQT